MSELWCCDHCQTKNPMQSNHCQSCGHLKKEAEELKSQKKLSYWKSQTHQHRHSEDFTTLELCLTLFIIAAISIMVIFVFISIIYLNDSLNFLSFTYNFLQIGVIILGGFIMAQLAHIIISLKEQVNHLIVKNELQTKQNEELIALLNEIKEK